MTKEHYRLNRSKPNSFFDMAKIVLSFRRALAISIAVAVTVFITLTASGVLAMHPQDPEPTKYEHEGAVIVSSVDVAKYDYKIGERVEIRPKLLNIGNEAITIMHGDPPFMVNVYSPFGIPAWSYPYPRLDIGIIVKLEPGVPYSWQKEKIQERYDIRLYFPGEYEIVSHTEFVIQEKGVPMLKTGEVYSKPVTIRVLP